MQKNVKKLKPHAINAKLNGNEGLPGTFLDSIREKGVLKPLVIKPDNSTISSHRRWRAARAIDLDKVPVRPVELCGNISTGSRGKTRDNIASKIGVGTGKQYEKAKKI